MIRLHAVIAIDKTAKRVELYISCILCCSPPKGSVEQQQSTLQSLSQIGRFVLTLPVSAGGFASLKVLNLLAAAVW